MSSAKTTYLENALVNHVLRNTAYTPPTTVYMALFTAAPGEAGGGTEVVGGSYARQSITFGAPSLGAASNTNTLTFSAVPSSTVTYIGIFDAVSAGNLLYYKALNSTIVTATGDDIVFPIGNVTVTEA